MRPETEGKIIVALIISLIAFGCGSGVGIVIGISQNDTDSPFSINYTQPEDFQLPTVTTKSPDISSTPSTSDSQNSDSEEVYVSKSNNRRSDNSNESTYVDNGNNGNTNGTDD
jgi:hypothetical protein